MNLKSHLTHPVFLKVSKEAGKRGLRAFAIGGFVRDAIMGRDCKDIDIVTEGSGITLARLVANSMRIGHVTTYKNFGTAMFKSGDSEIEFVGARKESYRANSRKPIVEDGTLTEDQNRRDFTINALAISLNDEDYGEVVDPFEGIKDIEKGILRTPLDPDITYSDDPLRMFRAIRFATQLDFTIEKKSLDAISKNASRLKIVSRERIADELNKIVAAPTPSIGFKLLMDTELLHQFFPEMVALRGVEIKNGVGHKDNFYHTLEVLDNVAKESDNLWLRWAAIMHDIAKPPTKKFIPELGWTFHGHEDKGARLVPKLFKRLKLPLDQKMKFVQKLVLLHLRPIALTKEEYQTVQSEGYCLKLETTLTI
jgi:poly(A) polymerase